MVCECNVTPFSHNNLLPHTLFGDFILHALLQNKSKKFFLPLQFLDDNEWPY
jgi:hypothetical protein